MTISDNQTTPMTVADINEQFLEMLPQIRRTVAYGLRSAPRHSRDDDMSECIANAFCVFTRLAQCGKADIAFPTVLAKLALRRLRDGRRVGSRRNSKDVLSAYAQRRRGLRVVSLGRESTDKTWEELVVEDKHAGPAEVTAVRLDFRTWLNRLIPLKRKVAALLAVGEATSDAARRFGITAGRISQLRKELAASWEQFQSDRPAIAVV